MTDSRTLRSQLIETMEASGVLFDQAVIRAFRNVPRECFLPGLPLDQIYQDAAIITKTERGVPVSSSSQPSMMAIMLQQLDVRPGMQVLEIGAGTGYNAALLQELVHAHGRVVTVEIDPEIAGWAGERLLAAGYPQVAVITGDGADGYAPAAPYDRVEVTVGAADIAPAWVDQLYPGGVLVLPLWINTAQVSVALEKQADGRLVSRSLQPCGFTRIQGKLAGRDRYVPLTPSLSVALDAPPLAPEQLRALLALPPRHEPWPGGSPADALFWLALREPSLLSVLSLDPATTGFSGAFGLVVPDEPSLALVTLPGPTQPPGLLSYGGDVARDRLLARLGGWRAAGKPRVAGWSLVAEPRDASASSAGDLVRDTAHWRLSFSIDRG